MANTSETMMPDVATVPSATRWYIREIAHSVDMANVRGNEKYPEIGISEHCVQKAADTINHNTKFYNNIMTMNGTIL